jgi:DNA-binding PadR family transcriptional regulator
MKFEDIHQFFEDPPPIYLNKELAVCYVLTVLLQQDSYGTELINRLSQQYTHYRLSDTVLYGALKFLEDEKMIDGYWKKVEGRGRPRRMYRLNPDWRLQAENLSELWKAYMGNSTQVNYPEPTPLSLSHR